MRKRLFVGGHAKTHPRVLRAACTMSQPETKESHLSPQDAFTWTFVLLGATGVLLVVALILGLLKLRVPTIVAALLAGGTSIAGSAINAGVTHGTSPLDPPGGCRIEYRGCDGGAGLANPGEGQSRPGICASQCDLGGSPHRGVHRYGRRDCPWLSRPT